MNFKKLVFIILFSLLVLSSTAQYIPPDIEKLEINSELNRLEKRFPPPEGFKQVETSHFSFQDHLQNLLLKPKGSLVKYFDGTTKPAEGVYVAVAEGSIGNKDLHQCADAIIRLRAEYLYILQKYDEIQFEFTNGFNADFSEWILGKRIKVEGNKCRWVQSAAPSHDYSVFSEYLEMVYMYAGTLSLERELVPTEINNIKIGDVFIQGGSPGHAVIVVNKAVQPQTNNVAICLAQSYMPAQETQILVNPKSENESPWYFIDENTDVIKTPEWTFKASDLKRFPDN